MHYTCTQLDTETQGGRNLRRKREREKEIKIKGALEAKLILSSFSFSLFLSLSFSPSEYTRLCAYVSEVLPCPFQIDLATATVCGYRYSYSYPQPACSSKRSYFLQIVRTYGWWRHWEEREKDKKYGCSSTGEL